MSKIQIQERNANRLANGKFYIGKSTVYRPSTRYKHLRSSTIRELAKEYSKENSPKNNLQLPEKEQPINIDIQTPHFIAKSHDPLDNFLASLGLEKYIQNFKQSQITIDDLPYITKDDFQDMGIPIGPRNRLIKALGEVITENSEENEEDDWNLVEDKEEIEEKEFDEKEMSLKEFEEIILQISQQQFEMMEAIEENQRSIAKLALAAEQETESNFSEGFSSRFESIDRSKSPSRLFQPTLSSMAKQRVIPNKYMRVSPLRAAYALKHLNNV